MPMYCYVCPRCEHRETLLKPVDERNNRPHCVKCEAKNLAEDPPAIFRHDGMERDIHAEQVHSTDQEYHTPVYSNSLGINPAQIPEAMQRFPHHEYAPDGRMILRSHNQRKRVMKELGYVDHDGY